MSVSSIAPSINMWARAHSLVCNFNILLAMVVLVSHTRNLAWTDLNVESF